MSDPGVHLYHLQWAAAAAPAPPLQAQPLPAPIVNSDRPATDEVRTIFITGLPADVKERELQNLLRWLPGYEASQINFKEEQPMGFALFSTSQNAFGAKAAVENLLFDAAMNSVLHVQMAKKNLYVKRGVGVDTSSFDQSKRMRMGGDYTHTVYANPAPYPPPAPIWGAPGYMPPPAPYDPYGGYPVPQVALPPPVPLPPPSVYAPVQVDKSLTQLMCQKMMSMVLVSQTGHDQAATTCIVDKNTKDNPPCNTLYIGNLGESIIEEELRGLFSTQPGFKQMKVLRQERNTVCFIEFNDVNSAVAVHQNLQGAVIPSSGRGGIRIHFSKNPLGQRKESVNGAMRKVKALTYQQ